MSRRVMDDVLYWRRKAAEARAISDQIPSPGSKLQMLSIASCYDKFARQAEQRGVVEETLPSSVKSAVIAASR